MENTVVSSPHCPLLGTPFDPSSHYAYPTEDNTCGSLRGPDPLRLNQQKKFCLNSNYKICPFFEVEPQDTRWSVEGRRWSKPWIVLIGLLVLLLALVIIFWLFSQPLGAFWETESTPTSILALVHPSNTTVALVNFSTVFPLILTPTATLTTLPSATSSPTASMTLTSTSTDTPISTHTPRLPQRTLTIAPTETPTFPVKKYSAPQLTSPANGQVSHKAVEVLTWQPVPKVLGTDEVYAVEFWRAGDSPVVIGWIYDYSCTRSCVFEMNSNASPLFGAGSYLWRVTVAQVRGDQTLAFLSEPSETWHLTWDR